jgi:flagellar motility protein MotE (MotC chaperone)
MTKIYDVRQIAIIIYYMRPASSAQVMAKLDPALAADVTELLTS